VRGGLKFINLSRSVANANAADVNAIATIFEVAALDAIAISGAMAITVSARRGSHF
jgi:hypothetical protein